MLDLGCFGTVGKGTAAILDEQLLLESEKSSGRVEVMVVSDCRKFCGIVGLVAHTTSLTFQQLHHHHQS